MGFDSDLWLSKIKVRLPTGRCLFAVDDLRVPRGTHLLIQGESGTGKTTFLHLIAGLLAPSEGLVSFGPTRLDSLTDDEKCDLRRDKIGVIFQKLNLLDHLTVDENVSLPLRRADPQIVESALAHVNLKERGRERCAHLSLGEQQRVAVARVLAQRPEILLADEPTSSLDEKNSDFVIRSLIEASAGKTLIVVSHDRRLRSHFGEVLHFEEFAR